VAEILGGGGAMTRFRSRGGEVRYEIASPPACCSTPSAERAVRGVPCTAPPFPSPHRAGWFIWSLPIIRGRDAQQFKNQRVTVFQKVAQRFPHSTAPEAQHCRLRPRLEGARTSHLTGRSALFQ
jgi:hypothetical protein